MCSVNSKLLLFHEKAFDLKLFYSFLIKVRKKALDELSFCDCCLLMSVDVFKCLNVRISSKHLNGINVNHVKLHISMYSVKSKL